MGNILKNGIDFGGFGMGKIIKNGVEFSGTTVIVEKPTMLFDDGQWLNTDKLSFNTVGGGIVGKKLVFTHTASSQDAIGLGTQSTSFTDEYAVMVKITNTGSQAINVQYGTCSPGYNITQIVMQGQGRGQYLLDTIGVGETKNYVVRAKGTETNKGVFFGLYINGSFSFEIEQIPFLN